MSDLYNGYLMEDSSPYNGNCNLQQTGFKPDPWRSSFHTDVCMKWQDNLQVTLTSRHASCQKIMLNQDAET